MTLKILSLFDGMSCGQIAINKLGITDYEYYASEVDKHAIKVTQHNYPNTIQLGDITKLSYKDGVLYSENGEFNVGKIDLLMGGSPCQSISNLGDKTGLSGKSSLFFNWLNIRDQVNPTHWLLENVKGSKDAINTITELVGGFKFEFNSSSVSAQERRRLYWCNISDIPQPKDKGLLLEDILEKEPNGTEKLTPGRLKWLLSESGQKSIANRYTNIDPIKAKCLTARSDASWNCNYVTRNGELTRLTPIEYERLQTVSDNYTSCVANGHRYKMLGNGWTVDVIVHIIKHMLITK